MVHAQRDLVELDLTENVLRSVQLYYTPMLVYFGSLGNCLSVIVFFGTKLCQYSSSIYLGALAISDTGFLISVFVVWLNMVEVGLFNRPGFCQFFIYLTTLCSFMSVWLVVAFTIERFIAVQYPLYRQSMCTVARAKLTVAILTVLGVILCSPVLWFSAPRLQHNEKGNVTECHLAEGLESWAIVYNVIDTVLTFAIPFTVIIILNVLIARAIYRHIKIRKSLTNEPRIVKERQPCVQNFRNNLAQTKITKMLLVVSSAFLCFNLPAYVLRIHAFLHFQEDNNAPRSVEMAQQVCNLLFNTNFGINFILYCATGQNFRRAIRSMFLKRFHRKNVTVTQVSNQGTQNVSSFTRPTSGTTRRHAIVFTEPWEEFHELNVRVKNVTSI
ncbi:Growth hormone secretagogue receptor type 1 [Habropoda laboriosa]|uniref:Growth hormone secretagogue receptor type 1 n=1 Tax=Habropoda laboriosa TaxID=597456 RepID=A0A0L7QZ99_9HYME|nr:PREDICTED: neuropeptides capa receptor-like [Habropoda laboriosa]KOC63881.1 Growth hormone secretagogue receptor type 1 [Habropoda laboriosa]